jgi:hypothetical protein
VDAPKVREQRCAAALSNCWPPAWRLHRGGDAVPLMVELVRSGHAKASVERMIAVRQQIEVARVRITEEGRLALAGRK